MKKLCVVLFILLFARHSFAAIAFISEAHNDTSAATSLTVSATISANNDVVFCFIRTGANAISSVVDNNSVAYTPALVSIDNFLYCYGKINAPAATSIVVTLAGSEVMSGIILQYSGVDSFGNTGTLTGGSRSTHTMSITTQENDNYIVCSFFDNGAGGTHTVTAGTGRLVNWNLNQGSRISTAIDNTSASPASTACTFTTASAITSRGAGVELRNPVAGTTPKHRSRLMYRDILQQLFKGLLPWYAFLS